MTDDLGIVVATKRTAMGLKRKDLAERARLSYPYISEIENGVKEPSAKALRQIAEALELSVSELAALSEGVARSEDPTFAVLHSGSASRDTDLSPTLTRAVHLPQAPASLEMQSLHPWLEEAIRALVRAELDQWSRQQLPALVRDLVDRVVGHGGSSVDS